MGAILLLRAAYVQGKGAGGQSTRGYPLVETCLPTSLAALSSAATAAFATRTFLVFAFAFALALLGSRARPILLFPALDIVLVRAILAVWALAQIGVFLVLAQDMFLRPSLRSSRSGSGFRLCLRFRMRRSGAGISFTPATFAFSAFSISLGVLSFSFLTNAFHLWRVVEIAIRSIASPVIPP
jgi:hypothetical protein